MNEGTVFALGTIVFWLGGFLLVAFLGQFARSILQREDRKARNIPIGFLSLALILFGGASANAHLPEFASKGIQIPLVWFVMPFWAWLALVLGVMGALRFAQHISSVSEEEKRVRVREGFGFLVGVLLSLAVLKFFGKPHFEVVGGAVPASLSTILVLSAFALIAILAMAAANRNLKALGVARLVSSHVALIVGSIIFGIPFAFLVITSFKEDRDMSSAEGIIWIPKVQRTVPYNNPKTPVYEANWNGRRVEGSVIEELPDDTVRIDIARPFAVRGSTFVVERSEIREIPVPAPLVTAKIEGQIWKGKIVENLEDGRLRVEFYEPASAVGQTRTFPPTEVEPIRDVGLRWQNYTEALGFLPPETNNGLVYLKNTLLIVVLNVIGTILSSALAAYAFSRLRFPGRDTIFGILLATLMLPAAVTLLPQFLIFKQLGWIDTLLPLWAPSFFGAAFNIFLLRQFFLGIPLELEDAAKVDGSSYLRTFWSVLLPQVKPALAVVAIWTFMGAWNNFLGPLIYINSPENMPISYALQMFQSDRVGEPGLLMAFATMAMVPVLLLFFFAQKYFIEGVALTGLGGR